MQQLVYLGFRLREQLAVLNIKPLCISLVAQPVTEQKESKTELIERSVAYRAQDVFIGDTGEDIITANKLGIRSVAVSWGILDRDVLKEYLPDYIIDDLEDLSTVI